jgi:hypothetical protein
MGDGFLPGVPSRLRVSNAAEGSVFLQASHRLKVGK